MQWFIGLVAILWIVLGIFGLLATRRWTTAWGNLFKNTKRQSLGLFALIVGVLLLISAPSAKEAWFIFALGILASLKGATIFLMPTKSLKAVIDWWLAAPEIVHKGWATALLILGIMIFYII